MICHNIQFATVVKIISVTESGHACIKSYFFFLRVAGITDFYTTKIFTLFKTGAFYERNYILYLVIRHFFRARNLKLHRDICTFSYLFY